MEIREAFTFDDVLLVPGIGSHSTADTHARVTQTIRLNMARC
jgi:IMP dehydrogenase